jgi:carbon monoxide dehydrogenase subunit G
VISVEREIDVERSADEVFERLTHIEDLPRWQPAITEASVTSPGPLDLGSTVRIVAVAAGQKTEAIGRIIEFVRPERVALNAKAGPADITARVVVTPLSARTCRVAIATQIELGGMLRFVEGMARARIEAEAPAAATAVKEWLETDA